MRVIEQKIKTVIVGDRVTKKHFLLLPRTALNTHSGEIETRWLETATVVYEICASRDVYPTSRQCNIIGAEILEKYAFFDPIEFLNS